MKNLFNLICLTLFTISTSLAQSTLYTPFEWDIIGVGVAIPVAEDGLTEGITLGGEVRYNVSNNVSIGLGTDFSFFDLEKLEDMEPNEKETIDFSSSTYISSDYYLSTTSSRRGFLGMGIGYTDIGDIEVTGDGDNASYTKGDSGMSISPRIGYELGHARFLVNYNIGLKDELSNHVSIKVALTLWGGYKG